MVRLNDSCVCESSREGHLWGEIVKECKNVFLLITIPLRWPLMQPLSLLFCFFLFCLDSCNLPVCVYGLSAGHCRRVRFELSNRLLQQVLKEKKPLTDWSNITGSTPCMMSVSPVTVHKAPQVGGTSSCPSSFSTRSQ